MKQLFVSLGLITSLLIGHVSACDCSHHVEKKAVEKPSCHSHPETTQTEINGDGDVCDTTCVCFVGQLTPFVVTTSPSKEFKAKDELAKAQQVDAQIEFVSITAHFESTSDFVANISYSTTLKSLLPSRAPPRL